MGAGGGAGGGGGEVVRALISLDVCVSLCLAYGFIQRIFLYEPLSLTTETFRGCLCAPKRPNPDKTNSLLLIHILSANDQESILFDTIACK